MIDAHPGSEQAGARSGIGSGSARSSPVPGLPDEDGESDDPLALTPLRPRSATQRKRQNASRSSLKAPRRQERTVDRVVGGVQMGEGDLVPPSDEEEFDDWAAQRLQEMQSELGDGSTVSRTRSESARPGMTPSSPTGMIRGKARMTASPTVHLGLHNSSPVPPTARRRSGRFVRFMSSSETEATNQDESESDSSGSGLADQNERLTMAIPVGPEDASRMTDEVGREMSVAAAEVVHTPLTAKPATISEPLSQSVASTGVAAGEEIESRATQGAVMQGATTSRRPSTPRITKRASSPTSSTSSSLSPPPSQWLGLERRDGDSTARLLTSQGDADTFNRDAPMSDAIAAASQTSTVFPEAQPLYSPNRPTRIPLFSSGSPKRRCMDARDLSQQHSPAVSQSAVPLAPPQSPKQTTAGMVNEQQLDLDRSPDLSRHNRPEVQLASSVISQGAARDIPGWRCPPGTSPVDGENNPSTLSAQTGPRVVDPELQRFRSTRTFRTRTALQLQPYTRERQVYEAVLRKGGLKSGRHAVARPKDISSGEEEGEEEELPNSPESEPPSLAEQIVIGATPEETRERRVFRHIPITDEDRNEYFLLYGVEPREDSVADAAKLQKIARKRFRAEREERRRRREERRAQREFESFLRKETEHEGAVSGDDGPEQEVTRIRNTRTTKAYERNRARPNAAADSPIGNAASLPQPPWPMSPLHFDTAEFPPPTPPTSNPSARLETPTTARRQQSITISPLRGHYAHDQRSPSVQFASQAQGRSDSSSQSDSSVGEQVVDKRARIARRMLPAAMLKRLEREAQDRERKKNPVSKHSVGSPAAVPGRAVKRQGHGEVDVFDLFEVEASSQSNSGGSQGGHEPELQVYNVHDSSSEDEGSQAEEDNRAGETLARLYEGDFESIIHGRAKPARAAKRSGPGARKDRNRRPPISLAPRVRSGRRGPRELVQTRLSLPSQEAPNKISRSARDKPRTIPIGRAPRSLRPAIRLDERTIFSARDFVLDDPDVVEVRPAAVRAKESVVPRTRAGSGPWSSKPAPLPAKMDADMGKARSWANFEKFSVDFDISPLPSGLQCSGFPVVRVGSLLDILEATEPPIAPYADPVSDLGVTFGHDMSALSMNIAVEQYFDKLDSHLFTQKSEPSQDAGDVVSMLSFMLLTSHRDGPASPPWEDTLVRRLDLLETKILAVCDNTGDMGDRHRQRIIFGVLWYLLELRLAIAVRDLSEAKKSAADNTLVAMFRMLLAAGFDRAIRPLKICLRGESINGEIIDLLSSLWISVIRSASVFYESTKDPAGFDRVLLRATTEAYHLDPIGPIAAERIWYITFGLGAMSQFNHSGRTTGAYQAVPRWGLVRKALSIIKIAHEEEAEERSHIDILRGRDRYVRVMIARCIRLSAVWKWSFSRESFAIVTRDLGQIFKQRQYRNFPTEPPTDYPEWITTFDIGKTAQPETKHQTAFEMYLRLVCVAASDIIDSAQTLEQAQKAEKDVQRLIISITPISPVKFNRILPPSPRQLAQLINRYATMVAGCYFSPSVLPWLLANARKWTAFESADFESRQITIRGLMYVGVACRHHGESLQPIIARLGEILQLLQKERTAAVQAAPPPPNTRAAPALESRRTMVLVISCFKQIILQSTYEGSVPTAARYPDPTLLDPSWTSLIFDLSARDHRSGLEVVGAIQAFLDARLEALPKRVQRAREERLESQDEFGSLGFELDPVTVAQLGGGGDWVEDPTDAMDRDLATVIGTAICPRIYRLLSDTLSTGAIEADRTEPASAQTHRESFVRALSQCWTDCAVVLVVDHRRLDWSTFIGPFGQQSWLRFGNENGRLEVGLLFMLNILRLDPPAFQAYQEEFISVFFSVIGTDKVSVEHRFLSALLRVPGISIHPVFAGVDDVWQPSAGSDEMSREEFFELRLAILKVILSNIGHALGSKQTTTAAASGASIQKPFLHRCVTDLVTSLQKRLQIIPDSRVIHKQSYQAFVNTVLQTLNHMGENLNLPLGIEMPNRAT